MKIHTHRPILETNESNMSSQSIVDVLKSSFRSLGRTFIKFLFRSVMPPNKMCPCDGVTTVNEWQTFIYTGARVWYSGGHWGSLASPLPRPLKLRGVVFLFSLFSPPPNSSDEGLWDYISLHKLSKGKWSMASAAVAICSCHGELVFAGGKLIWKLWTCLKIKLFVFLVFPIKM